MPPSGSRLAATFVATAFVTAGSCLTFLVPGCSFETQEAALRGGTFNPVGVDGGVVPERTYVSGGGSSSNGGACGSNSFVASNLPPDLLLVLDRSGSMNEDAAGMTCAGGCGATSKWTQMTAAINTVVARTESKVRWGLKLFASGSEVCNVNAAAEVAIAPMNAAAIKTAIAGAIPGSATPTRAAETQAAAYLGSLTDPNPKYILLATDGLPNCPQSGTILSPDDAAATSAVATVAAAGFPTFVIGIATSGSTADATLNAMAKNGGHPRAASPQYYPVSTSQDLETALNVIQGMVALPCQFQLGGVPSNLGEVTVSVGGQIVSASEWTYGPGNRSIVFPDSGTTCANLKSGVVKDVKINLPCGETVVP